MERAIYQYKSIPVSYQIIGKGEPLLILHGWGSNGSVMLPAAKNLSDIRTCYILDLPGFGETPPPDKGWDVSNYAHLCIAFVENVIENPCDVIAHSFGGRIILKWAAQEKEKKWLNKIIITGGAGMKPRRKPSYYFRRGLATLLKAPFLILPRSLREKKLIWLRNTKLWKSLGSSGYQSLHGPMRETFVKTVTENLEYCLPDITHDVLLLWGKNDTETPWNQAERMEKGLQAAGLAGIPGAGHYAFLDQPQHFNRIVRNYLHEKE